MADIGGGSASEQPPHRLDTAQPTSLRVLPKPSTTLIANSLRVLLGHRSLASTLVYTHASDESLRAAVARTTMDSGAGS